MALAIFYIVLAHEGRYGYPGIFLIYEYMVQIRLMLTVLFTQDSEIEDLFYGSFPG